jgi:DNA-binding PadR family transcriptional regulator
MSTTRMLMLGLIRWVEPVHGYEVRRELISWNVEEWANVAPGSIYHALRKLTEEGLLEEVGTEKVSGRPARTLYRTTRFGREEFERLLRKYWWEQHTTTDPFVAAVSFLPALPRREAVLALRNRAAVLRGHVAQNREVAARFLADKPVHVSWLMELSAVRAEAEIEWCERVAARVEGGEGQHEGDPGEPFEGDLREWKGSFDSQI